MKRTSYSDLLKHPQWQKKRLQILERDNFKCKICTNENSTLHVHHLKYVSGNKPWEYDDDELITVCDQCHENIHWTGISDKNLNVLLSKVPSLISGTPQKDIPKTMTTIWIGVFIEIAVKPVLDKLEKSNNGKATY